MFVSFFPRPGPFFLSLIGWTIAAILFWYLKDLAALVGVTASGGRELGGLFGMPPAAADAAPIVGLSYFWTPEFLWFDIYYLVCTGIFAGFWFFYAPHRWAVWSILGSAAIIFMTYFGVQVDVALNNWRLPFFDSIQQALNPDSQVDVTAGDLYGLLGIFLVIATAAISLYVIQNFFVSHYVFRWRTAMNNYYMANWDRLRKIEGASQRVQEDTMRFARTLETLGVALIDAVMTLIAFTPMLWVLSSHITELPIVGSIPAPLVVAAIVWSLFGTLLLAVVGIRLPGLEFKNQRVEAAYRKELVYGEDDPARCDPPTVAQLFANVRRNYFTLYFNYAYFNLARMTYLQADVIFGYFVLVPTIAAGVITFGIMQQILTALNRVANSFQYLINSWPTVVDMLSIYKRLRAFEATLDGEELPEIDRKYLEREAQGVRPEEQPAS